MTIHKSALSALIVTLCCAATAFAAGSPAATPTSAAAPVANAIPPGPGDLNTLIAAGTLPDLRWPNFTDYRANMFQSFMTRDRIRRHGFRAVG